ncbi:MAG TPA: metalloregulator ArsR/SmtB family transcription factor [Candidatus Paceibacterota bacterium]
MDDKGLERTLKALANRRRIRIVRLLKKRKEMSVGSIAEAIKLSFRATSRHLATLSSANVLDKEQRSVQMLYRLAHPLPPAAEKIVSLL